MRLSRHFDLREMTRSQIATRLAIDNTPDDAAIGRLRALCLHVLEPIRIALGVVSVSSGYRSPALNKAIGGSPTSQHVKGEAVDFEIPPLDNLTVARWLHANDQLPFDQLILEFHKIGDPRSGWIHVSHSAQNRRQVLTAVSTPNGVKYIKGLPVLQGKI